MLFAIGIGACYLVLAAWIHVWRAVWVTDAIARTANAMYVVFSRDPHLAAMGFVWLPGPTVVQIPLVLVLDTIRQPLLAGNVLTVVTSSGSLWVLWKIMERLSVPRRYALAMLLPYALNPMTVYYAANGMSESPFIFLLLVVIWQFIVYTGGPAGRPLFLAGMALAGAVWTRYEALPVMGALAIAITLVEVARSEEISPVSRAEATLLSAISAGALSFFLWLFFNQIITGDPLYFIHSSFGPGAQLKALLGEQSPEVVRASTSLLRAAVFGAKRIVLLSPFFLPLTAAATVLAITRRDWRLIGVLGIGSSVLVFSVYQLGTGGSFGWLRFFMYCQPLTLVFAVTAVAPFRAAIRRRIYALVAAGMLLAIPTTGWALSQPRIASEEARVVHHIVDPSFHDPEYETRAVAVQIAAYIDALPPEQTVYVETFLSFRVAALARHRHRLVITNDADAGVFLDDPVNKLDYMLVPKSGGLADLGELAARFPGLFENGAPWVALDREWKTSTSAWRLYRVIKGPTGRGE